jgi:alkylhydroperoxidase/carboxymuconolactone decarboxylase family protein YurZ
MNQKEEATIRYYEQELGWVPPFVRVLAKYSPGSLDGYLAMRRAVSRTPPEGALPKKIKDLIFAILDCVAGDANGAKAHAVAAIDAGLTMNELVEGFVIAAMVTGIPTLCNLGVQAIDAAEARLEAKQVCPSATAE